MSVWNALSSPTLSAASSGSLVASPTAGQGSVRAIKGTSSASVHQCLVPDQRETLRTTPVERRAKLALEQRGHLSRLGKAAFRLLAEHELAVQDDVEAAAAAALQLDRAHDRRPAAQHLGRQAHGLVKVVSRDAVLDPP